MRPPGKEKIVEDADYHRSIQARDVCLSPSKTAGLSGALLRAVEPRTFQLGIAGRLGISFAAVAVLAVVANLIVEGKVSVLPAPVVHQERRPAPVVAPPPAPAPVVEVPAPAPVRPPFPSVDPLQRALDRIDHAVDGSADGDVVELTTRYQKLGTELERTAAEFSSGATAAGESPPARLMVTVRAYRQQGADLIELTATRRKLMSDYSARFEQLNTRVKKSLDHAWKIFGRVVARQSLVKLTSDLDDLRRRYVEFVSAETVDSSTFDTLGASEGTLAQTLAQDRAGFTSAEGQDWYTKSQADLQAMSDARRALLKVDRDRKEGARKFSEEAATLASILGRMGKTETYVARHPVAHPKCRQGSQPLIHRRRCRAHRKVLAPHAQLSGLVGPLEPLGLQHTPRLPHATRAPLATAPSRV